jgi:hypothetical protein
MPSHTTHILQVNVSTLRTPLLTHNQILDTDIFALLKNTWRTAVERIGLEFSIKDAFPTFISVWLGLLASQRDAFTRAWAKRGYSHDPMNLDLLKNVTLQVSGQADYLERKRRWETANGMPTFIARKETALNELDQKLSNASGKKRERLLKERETASKELEETRERLVALKSRIAADIAAGISYDFAHAITDAKVALAQHAAQLKQVRVRNAEPGPNDLLHPKFKGDGTRLVQQNGVALEGLLYHELKRREGDKEKLQQSRAERRKANEMDVRAAFAAGLFKYKSAKQVEDYFSETIGVPIPATAKTAAEKKLWAERFFLSKGVQPPAAPAAGPVVVPAPPAAPAAAPDGQPARLVRAPSGVAGCS